MAKIVSEPQKLPDREIISKLLSKLRMNPAFETSTMARELLTVLVQRAAGGNETPMGSNEICKALYLKKESNISAYAARLRRGLDEYYAHEGKDDEIVITLPPGSGGYRVVLSRREPQISSWHD